MPSRIKFIRSVSMLTASLGLLLMSGCNIIGSARLSYPTVDVRQYGAVGDGQTVDTRAIQSAIDQVADDGGGTIAFSSGQYVTGSLLLRSHVTLRIDPDSSLVGSTAFADYRNLESAGKPLPTSLYGQDEAKFRGMLIGLDQDEITITGGGTIDGRGAAVAAAIHQMQVDHLLPGNPKQRPDESFRPCLINLVRCHHIRIADITLRDSACWVENYSACEDLTVDHVAIISQAFWNNDGIDISGCKHVRVIGCDIDSADDGICLKSNASACEDVVIRDCRVRSWANAIKFGTVSFIGFRHISISNCEVWGCGHAGLAIESVDGALIEDVNISNIRMYNLRQAILVKLGARHTPDGKVGAIRDVTLKDITADLADGDPDARQRFHAPTPSYKHNRFPCVVSGLPDHPIERLNMSRIVYRTSGGGTAKVATVPVEQLAGIPENAKAYPEYSMHGELPAFGWFIRHAAGLSLDGSEIDCRQTDDRAAVVCDDVSYLNIAHLHVNNGEKEGAEVVLQNVQHANIFDRAVGNVPKDSPLRVEDR